MLFFPHCVLNFVSYNHPQETHDEIERKKSENEAEGTQMSAADDIASYATAVG